MRPKNIIRSGSLRDVTFSVGVARPDGSGVDFHPVSAVEHRIHVVPEVVELTLTNWKMEVDPRIFLPPLGSA